MWILKKIDCGLKVVPQVQPEVWIPGVPATRGASFEHRNGHECTDPKFHRHWVGRWRGSASLGFAAAGNRIRRRVTGSTKTAVLEAMAELREELGRAPRSSRTYTVNEAVASHCYTLAPTSP